MRNQTLTHLALLCAVFSLILLASYCDYRDRRAMECFHKHRLYDSSKDKCYAPTEEDRSTR